MRVLIKSGQSVIEVEIPQEVSKGNVLTHEAGWSPSKDNETFMNSLKVMCDKVVEMEEKRAN